MKSKYIPLIIVIALSVGVYVGFFFAQRQQENILNTFGGISAEDVPQSKTSVLLNMIETQYVDTVNMAQIEEKIIDKEPDKVEEPQPEKEAPAKKTTKKAPSKAKKTTSKSTK